MATRIWHFSAESISDYKMSYGNFLEELALATMPAPVAKPRVRQSVEVKQEPAQPTPEQLAKALAELEQRIAELEDVRDALYAQMADPTLYEQGGGQETVLHCRQVEQELQQLYARWEQQARDLEEAY